MQRRPNLGEYASFCARKTTTSSRARKKTTTNILVQKKTAPKHLWTCASFGARKTTTNKFLRTKKQQQIFLTKKMAPKNSWHAHEKVAPVVKKSDECERNDWKFVVILLTNWMSSNSSLMVKKLAVRLTLVEVPALPGKISARPCRHPLANAGPL